MSGFRARIVKARARGEDICFRYKEESILIVTARLGIPRLTALGASSYVVRQRITLSFAWTSKSILTVDRRVMLRRNIQGETKGELVKTVHAFSKPTTTQMKSAACTYAVVAAVE